jgi:hypothetical protein
MLQRDGLKKVAAKEKLRSEGLNQGAGGRPILRVIKAKHRHPPRRIWFETVPNRRDFNASAREVKNLLREWYNLMPYLHMGVAQAGSPT